MASALFPFESVHRTTARLQTVGHDFPLMAVMFTQTEWHETMYVFLELGTTRCLKSRCQEVCFPSVGLNNPEIF